VKLRRWLVRIGSVLVALVLVAAALYEFGGMWPASDAAQAAYAAGVAAGRRPAVPSRFTIPIPGCVCHSNDPVLIAQHSTRRISECAGCHG
jgi:hypothetical protein